MPIQLGGGNFWGLSNNLPDLLQQQFWATGDPWVTDISDKVAFPTHARSDAILLAHKRDGQGNLLSTKLAILGDTTNYGFPYHVVPENQPLVPIAYDAIYGLTGYDGQVFAPIPADLSLEAVPYGGTLPTALDGNDHHAIICVRDDTIGSPTFGMIKWVYELYSVYVPTPGAYTVSRFVYRYPGSGNRYDDRPEGFPTTNAAGTRILPGLIRHDELTAAIAVNGDLGRALRFDMQFVRNNYTAPARVCAGYNYDIDSDVMCCGTRLRLKASFDISAYSPGLQVILRTLKKYGMILDDTGGQFQLQATMDKAWGVRFTPYFEEIQLVDVLQNFEVIDHPKGFSFTLASNTGAAGAPVSFTSSILPPYTNIDPSHFTGNAFNAYPTYADAVAQTNPVTSVFSPYRVNYSNGDVGPKSGTFTPPPAAAPYWILGLDNTIGRESALPIPYYAGVSPPATSQPVPPWALLMRRRKVGVVPVLALPVFLSASRARQGDTVVLWFDAPYTPTAIPTAAVLDGLGRPVLSFPVPFSARPLRFMWPFKMPPGSALGTFFVRASVATAQGTYTGSVPLALVAGGDSGGRVISLFGYDRPEGRHVLAHLDTGILVQGSNPHF